MISYLLRHAQVLVASIGQMARTPGATLMTVMVIGITLTLPVLLYLLVTNIERATHNWRSLPQLVVYLKPGTGESAVRELTDTLRARGDVARTQYISADSALAEFKERSGFGDALDGLGENPLPASVIIYLKAQSARAEPVARLIAELVARPEVDSARSDTEWIERLHVTLRLVERAVIGLALLLVFAVIIIISNTIRLAVLNRRDEIEIVKLIGGTNAFIRRPFLYAGLLQGVAGAALAVGLVLLSVQLMRHPTADLARLYASGFVLQGLDWRLAGALLVAGGVLGWVASRWSVGRHLAAIEPR